MQFLKDKSRRSEYSSAVSGNRNSSEVENRSYDCCYLTTTNAPV